TYAWLVKDEPAISAAWFASRLAATYVESAQDRFTPAQLALAQSEARSAERLYGSKSPRNIPGGEIYLAAPFFNTAQQWLVDEVRDALLELGLRVFSPIHDVGLGEPNEVAPANLTALDRSALLFALLDDIDAGTIFEVGYARAKSIPVVGVAES